MTIGTIFLLLCLLAGALISVFYLQFSSVAIAGVLVLFPVAMFICLLLLRMRTSVRVDSKNPVADKDDMDRTARPSITLTVENGNKILPITKGIAKVTYCNTFTGEKGKTNVRFSVDAGRKRDRRITVPVDNCGNIAITVHKVRIYDYLSIFAWTIGRDFETQNILVLPSLREMYLGKDRWYNETSLDSDRFSLYKKGDDPSEIFDIRSFMDGDKIQRIHWKLSSKTGSLMVKEGSLPLTKVVNIFIDLCVDKHEEIKNKKKQKKAQYQDMNLLVQGIYSVAMFMIEHAIPQKYIWYDKENDIVQERVVEQEEELLWMFQDLFRCSITHEPEELVMAYLAWEEGKQLESAMYLTVSDHGDIDQAGIVGGRLEVMDLRGDDFEIS